MSWVFGYGSLLWRPGFQYQECRRARLAGYHRAFCRYSWRHRGTPSAPGLVVGLLPGGTCEGIAYRLEANQEAAALAYLDDREGAGYLRVSLPLELTPLEIPSGLSNPGRRGTPGNPADRHNGDTTHSTPDNATDKTSSNTDPAATSNTSSTSNTDPAATSNTSSTSTDAITPCQSTAGPRSAAQATAWVYLPNPDHPTCAPNLPREEIVRLVATGKGYSGTAYDYLVALIEQLNRLNLDEIVFRAVLAEAGAYRARQAPPGESPTTRPSDSG